MLTSLKFDGTDYTFRVSEDAVGTDLNDIAARRYVIVLPDGDVLRVGEAQVDTGVADEQMATMIGEPVFVSDLARSKLVTAVGKFFEMGVFKNPPDDYGQCAVIAPAKSGEVHDAELAALLNGADFFRVYIPPMKVAA